MSGIEETIDVRATPEVAYALWADFARYGEFVKGVERVERHGDRLHWVARSAGRTTEWDAVIVAEEPGHRLAWQAPDGPIDTEIIFAPADGEGTHVVFREQMHDSLPAQAAAATGYAGRRAQADLERFKELVEA
jgi:uncharacterized membrane protein